MSMKYAGYVFIVGLLALCAWLVTRFFAGIDIAGTSLALDWVNLYPSLEGGWLRYEDTGLRQAPWSILPLLPLGLLNQGAGWGLLAFITVMVLVAAVPRHHNRGLYVAGVFLTVLSYPALRTIADGNFEIVSTAGALLVVYAYRKEQPLLLAAGALLASSKPQVSVLLLLVAGVSAVAHWQRRRWLTAAGVTFAVIVPSLLVWGGGWLDSLQRMEEYGSIMDSSLIAAANRTGVIPPLVANGLRVALVIASLWLCYHTRPALSREKAGMLIAASLLVAPYAAGNSALSVYAVGVIPFFFKQRGWGVVLVVLTNGLFLLLANTALRQAYSAYYWTVYFVVVWAVLGWHVFTRRR